MNPAPDDRLVDEARAIRLASPASRTAAASTVSPEMVNWTGNGCGMVFLHDAQQHLKFLHYFFYEELRDIRRSQSCGNE